MQQPNVRNVILDKKRDVRYEIIAYRKLTQAEMEEAVASLWRQLRRKRLKLPKKGDRFIIETIIGFDS
ncbi:MAG: hypothetical protein ABW250_22520 [Pyrinomonadaceae bacterium]